MGGIVSGFFGSSTPSPPNIQVWQPQYTNQADTQAYNSITGINQNNPYAANQPAYQGVLNASLNNPYAAPAQTAANTAGQQYANLGTQGAAAGNALNTGAMSLLPYISSVMNTALDPQNALYKQQYQQLQDQAGVTAANQGLTGSPYAVGVQNQANTNFNIDWQNNLLQRQLAGLSGAGNALQQAASGAGAAQNIGTTAAANTGLSGAAPLATYNANLKSLQDALNNYGLSQIAGNQNTQTAVGDLLNYMSLGAQQSNSQAQATEQNYQNQLAAANATNQGISSLVNSVLGGLNAGGGGFSSGLNAATAQNSLNAAGFSSALPASDAEWASFLARA